MRHLTFLLPALLLFLPALVPAQTAAEITVDRVNETLNEVALGIPEKAFMALKPRVGAPDTTMSFRHEFVESVGKDGFSGITYYFDAEMEKPLYEFILEFTDEKTRRAAEALILGPPNHPERAEYWILGAQDFVVSMAWAFENKIVVAANLPGSEWEGDPSFSIPENFQPYQIQPSPKEWPAEERMRFLASLVRQIEAGAGQFAAIRGDAREEDPAYFYCTAPLSIAEDAAIFQDDEGRWTVGNTMASGMPFDDSENWKADMRELINAAELKGFQLRPDKAREDFGGIMEVWQVLDANGKNMGLAIGLVNYEWDAEGLWSVDILVMMQ